MHRILVILLLLFLAACSGPIPANTGVQGQVFIGPMCPAVQRANPCPDRPYPAILSILTPQGKNIKRFTADIDGRFQFALAPGSYILRPENPANLPLPVAPEQSFSVIAGHFTQLKVTYDSGIR